MWELPHSRSRIPRPNYWDQVSKEKDFIIVLFLFVVSVPIGFHLDDGPSGPLDVAESNDRLRAGSHSFWAGHAALLPCLLFALLHMARVEN